MTFDNLSKDQRLYIYRALTHDGNERKALIKRFTPPKESPLVYGRQAVGDGDTFFFKWHAPLDKQDVFLRKVSEMLNTLGLLTHTIEHRFDSDVNTWHALAKRPVKAKRVKSDAEKVEDAKKSVSQLSQEQLKKLFAEQLGL